MPLIPVRPSCCICGATPDEGELAAERVSGLPVCLDPFGCVSRVIQVLQDVQDERDRTDGSVARHSGRAPLQLLELR